MLMDNKDRESLVVQLQREVVNSGVPISDILRRAKILASLLKNEEFKGWIDAELGGYNTADSRPEYRKFRPMSFGTFAGPFGKMVKNVPIPVALLPTELQDVAGRQEISQGVKEIETLAAQASEEGAVRIAWPPEAVILARDHVRMDDGCMLVQAWKALVKGQLDGILAWIIREDGDSGGDAGASVWYKRCATKRLATTEAPAWRLTRYHRLSCSQTSSTSPSSRRSTASRRVPTAAASCSRQPSACTASSRRLPGVSPTSARRRRFGTRSRS